MNNIDSIIKKANELGWAVKPFEDDSYYRFSKRIGDSEELFNFHTEGESPKEIIKEIREKYLDFDLPLEVSCWVDDKGVPYEENTLHKHYKDISQINKAFEDIEKDILNLYLNLDVKVCKNKLKKRT